MIGSTVRPGTARAQWAVAVPALRASALPFIVSRALVLIAVWVARVLASEFHMGRAAANASHAGLLAWDASWYQRIAAGGYSSLGDGALRFFPLLSVLARSFRAVPGVTAGEAVIIVANIASLAAFAVLYRIVVFELGDEGCARRAVWLLALAPPAFVLVMGYADSLLVVTSLVAFLGLRQRRYGLAIGAGFLAGLSRPVGMLLAIPAAIEMGANWFSLSRRDRMAAFAAVIAAPAGAAAYLGWVREVFGQFLLPFREQLSSSHRGAVADPFVTVWSAFVDFVHGTHLGVAEHALWALLFVVLAGYLLSRLPASYGWYSVGLLAVVLTASNLASLERYGLGSFPFVVAAAMLARGRNTFRVVIGLSGLLMFTCAVLAFLAKYVP